MHFLYTYTLALHLVATRAQTCFNDNHPDSIGGFVEPPPYLNASGSVSFPGFQYPGQTPSNWTLSVNLQFDNTTENGKPHYMWEKLFTLETNPPQNLSSPDLPYTGCDFIMEPFLLSSPEGADANNTCKGMVSDDCQAVINHAAQEFANGFNFSDPTPDPERCAQLGNAIVDATNSVQCKNIIRYTFFGYPIFGNQTYYTIPDHPSPSCSDNVGSGSTNSAWIDSYIADSNDFDSDTSPEGQLAAYRNSLKSTLPLFLVGWPRNQSVAAATVKSNTDLIKTSLTCVSLNNILPGSETSDAVARVANLGLSAVLAGVCAAGITVFF